MNNNNKKLESTIQDKQHNLTVLQGLTPCHKKYRNGIKGATHFTTDYHLNNFKYSNTLDLYNILKECSKDDDVGIISGQNVEGLDTGIVQRRNVQFADKENKLLIVDFDNYPLPDNIQNWTPVAIEYVIKVGLPKEFHDASYAAQWSSSSGVKRVEDGEMVKSGFNCHLFFISDTVLTSKDIKERLFNGWIDEKIDGKRKHGVDGSLFQQVQICFITSKPDIDYTFVDILANVEKFAHVKKSLDEVPVKLKSLEAAKKAKQRQNKTNEAITGFKKMNNADAEIIMTQLIELGTVRSINRNGTMNLYAGPESTGGSFVYEYNPEWIYTNGKSVHVKKWVEQYWNASIMMPEEVRINGGHNGMREVKSRIYTEYSDGNLDKLRDVLSEFYDGFKADVDTKSLVVITNPGVGKTISLPNHFSKLIYSKNSNKSVRELYNSLTIEYSDLVIQQIFNFKEIFKEKYPHATIVEYESKDVFGGMTLKWNETFEIMENSVERDIAETMYYDHISNTNTVNYDADIIVITNYKLNKLKHEHHKKFYDGHDWFDAKKQYYEQTKDVKVEKIKKWLHHQVSKFDNELIYKEFNLENEWTIVVDDPTASETGLFQRIK